MTKPTHPKLLHTLPFLIALWSFLGGLYMQLDARQYPDELAGLVPVDSTHPQQMQGSGAMDRPSAWVPPRACTSASRRSLHCWC
jgi:hypothetical protein